MAKESNEINPMQYLKEQGFHFKKKWGQNFIFDKNLLNRIVKAAQIRQGDEVVEIGPGAGSLTKCLLEAGARVLAVEIDDRLVKLLTQMFSGRELVIVQGDILKMNIDDLTQKNGFNWPYKLVANLPYYITTPILMNLLENEYHLDLLVIMVQWEVAQRLTAKPGTKEYGAVTLAVNYYTESEILFKVPRTLFTPVPEVDSAVLCLRPRTAQSCEVRNKKLMFRLIKAAFNQRRKTLANSLLGVDPLVDKVKMADIFAKAGIQSQRRGETLSLQEFALLANTWQEYTKGD